MNERIRELAKQSYKEVIETNDYNGDAYTVREFDQEKFAELIVRECKAVMLDMMNNKQGDFNTLDLALTEINEHFGVE